MEQAAGGALPGKTEVEPHPTWLAGGFDPAGNPAGIFLKLVGGTPLDFGANGAGDKAGGIATPNMSIGGISRDMGPIGGDVSSIPTGFDPDQFFSDAKILGGILLAKIIQAAGLDKAPAITSRVVYPNNDQSLPPTAVEANLHLAPGLKADPLGVFDPTGASLTIDATVLQPLDPPGDPAVTVIGELKNFKVNMIGDQAPAQFIILEFSQLTFTSRPGKKPVVDVSIIKTEFTGPLDFVNTLKDFLQTSGGSGLSIDLTPTQITAGLTLAIPTINVGIVAIQNIVFGAGFMIPFTGDPFRVRFSFSERDDPFMITVYGIGGGGFFGIAIGVDGVELLEASLEFGASIALDIGVASGEVSIVGGIYFKMEVVDGTEQASLTAYIRLNGRVEVLGIITISVEFYLGLTYDITNNELWGQARLEVEIEILFFSVGVTMEVERKLAGGDGGNSAQRLPRAAGVQPDRRFADLVSPADWSAYAAAFAPVPSV